MKRKERGQTRRQVVRSVLQGTNIDMTTTAAATATAAVFVVVVVSAEGGHLRQGKEREGEK